MKLETFLQILEPGHLVRLDTGQEVESAGVSDYEWMIPEDLLEREVTSVRCFIEPDDPGIRLVMETAIGNATRDRGCFLDDFLGILTLEEEAEVHVRRGSEKLGHASAQRIEAMLAQDLRDKFHLAGRRGEAGLSVLTQQALLVLLLLGLAL